MKKLKLGRTWLGAIAVLLKQVTPIKIGVSLIALCLLIIVCSQNWSEKLDDLSVTGSNTLIFPLPPINEDWKTTISIINLEDKRVNIKLSSINEEDEQSLAETFSITTLEAGETNTIETESRSLMIESNGSILGTALIETTDGKKSEVIPAIKEASTQLDFPTLADGDTPFKNITLLNVDSSPANIEVIALHADGHLIDHETSLTLLSMESWTFNIGDFFSSQSLD